MGKGEKVGESGLKCWARVQGGKELGAAVHLRCFLASLDSRRCADSSL